jgi:D-alanine-D-alanine ligase
MKVGITYDLRDEYLKQGFNEEETAEFDRKDTIDAIEEALRALGHRTVRIGHVRSLLQALLRGERWDLVFNIAEGLYGVAREALIPAILDAYQIPYTFSDPLVLALSLHKGMTKRIISSLGIPTPNFAEVDTLSQVEKITLTYPLFVKPVAEGTGKGITENSKIESKGELVEQCRYLLEKYKEPVLVEEYVGGREFTVGIIGTGEEAEAIGTLEVIPKQGAEAHAYSYENKEKCEELIEYRLYTDKDLNVIAAMALAAWRGLGCRDAGRVDFRCDEKGNPFFLEINPLAGLHPSHSDLPIVASQVGISYLELIKRIMTQASQRLAPGQVKGY